MAADASKPAYRKAERERRLAEALRANLNRRKAKKRDRPSASDDPSESTPTKGR